MDLEEFKIATLGIDKEKFGRIFSFVDFGNMNYWYEKDIKDWQGNILNKNQKQVIGIEKLSHFLNLFSDKKMFYYGIDLRNRGTWHISKLARDFNFSVVTKPIQWVKNYFDLAGVTVKEGGRIKKNQGGYYLESPKCNFDVELTIDAIRFSDSFETCALFSGDSDFASLLRFLRLKNKRVILFYSGRISRFLEENADLLINAQDIKGSVVFIKERTP